MTAPFMPMIFQGEEWGAHAIPLFHRPRGRSSGERYSRGGGGSSRLRVGPMSKTCPSPQAAATFERSRLNWSEGEEHPHAALLDWHRRLIRLRRAIPDLADGRLEHVQVSFDEHAQWLVLQRRTAIVACNLAPRMQHVRLQLRAHRNFIGIRSRGLLDRRCASICRRSRWPCSLPCRYRGRGQC